MAAMRSLNSRLTKKHRPFEEEVAFKDLVVGERYNVYEIEIVEVPKKNKKGYVTQETKYSNFSGEFMDQDPRQIHFINVVAEGGRSRNSQYQRTVSKPNIEHIKRIVFPGLPEDLQKKIHSLTKKAPNKNAPNKNGYKQITNPVKLSPGDELKMMNGKHIVVDSHVFAQPKPFGRYKGELIHSLRKKLKASGKNTKKTN